jgi:hypothetical protein
MLGNGCVRGNQTVEYPRRRRDRVPKSPRRTHSFSPRRARILSTAPSRAWSSRPSVGPGGSVNEFAAPERGATLTSSACAGYIEYRTPHGWAGAPARYDGRADWRPGLQHQHAQEIGPLVLQRQRPQPGLFAVRALAHSSGKLRSFSLHGVWPLGCR